jgi:ribosome-associated protein
VSPDQSVRIPVSVDLPSKVAPKNRGQSSPAVRVQRLAESAGGASPDVRVTIVNPGSPAVGDGWSHPENTSNDIAVNMHAAKRVVKIAAWVRAT